MAALTFLVAAIVRMALWGQDGFVGTWSDDFYYYIRIATNVVAGHGSTFDGVIPTNGYHPLWMACQIGLIALLGTGRAYFLVLVGIVATGTALTFLLARALSSRLSGARGLVSCLIGLYTAVYYFKIASNGMEILLTIPLLLAFAIRALSLQDTAESPRSALWLGLLGSFVVLSRIDSLVYVSLFVLGYLAFRRFALAVFVRQAPWFVLGLTPLAAYFILNLHWFGELLPISGVAKQLKEAPLSQLRVPYITRGGRVFDLLLFWPSVVSWTLALLLGWFARARVGAFKLLVLVLPLVLFPVAFYFAQAVVSDWALWIWYLYPLVVSFPVGLSLLALSLASWLEPIDERARAWLARWRLAALAFAVAVPVLAVVVVRRTPAPEYPMQVFALTLARFANTHPGRYAMGDRAGTVGFLLPNPLLQLEGLVEDRRFIDNIKHRRDLLSVLREYQIDYYVANAPKKVGSCFETLEPLKAGPTSPQMVGRFCSEPVLTYQSAADGASNAVFELVRE